MSFNIIGTGSRHPSLEVDNHKLSEFLDTSDEWISQRTGIKARKVLSGESLAQLAGQAAKQALEDAQLSPKELDYILVSTTQGDYLTPSLACLVQEAVGATCPAYDLNAACTGFLYALDAASAYFDAGRAKNILVVGAEAPSRYTDWQDRSTCVLFGDGAGAAVLTKGDGLLAMRLTAVGGAGVLNVPAPTGNSPFIEAPRKQGYISMNGQEVYKFAVSAVEADVDTVLAQASLTPDEIRFYLLHQANSRIIEGARKRLAQPPEKFPMSISRLGNTSSASIPMLLDELNREGRLNPGDKLLFSAFGGGMTTGACILRWGK